MLQEIIDLGEIKEQGITNLIYPQRLAKLINHPNIATNHIRLQMSMSRIDSVSGKTKAEIGI